jgi:hypothetical protein
LFLHSHRDFSRTGNENALVYPEASWPNGKALDYDQFPYLRRYQEIPGSTPGVVIIHFYFSPVVKSYVTQLT